MTINFKVKGMTLTELLLVLALVGILLSLAIPRLLPLITKTKSLEAQMQLKHLLTLEKNYFYVNSKYTSDLTELGFEQEKLVTDGGKSNYRIEMVSSSPSGYLARATSVVDFDQDGVYNVWEVSEEGSVVEITKD